jgi:hypothetical protein
MRSIGLELSASYLWSVALTWTLISAFDFMIYFVWAFQPAHHSLERM